MNNPYPYIILFGLVIGVIIATGSGSSDSIDTEHGSLVADATNDPGDVMVVDVVAEPETDTPVPSADRDTSTQAEDFGY